VFPVGNAQTNDPGRLGQSAQRVAQLRRANPLRVQLRLVGQATFVFHVFSFPLQNPDAERLIPVSTCERKRILDGAC
jgi:hypothetical protein